MNIELALANAKARRSLPPPAVRRLLRLNAGLSQTEIGWALGVGAPAVCRYESGQRAPRGERARAYLELLDRLAEEATHR